MITREIFAKYTDPETFAKITDYSCITQMWTESVANYGDSVAIVDGESYTYNQLDTMVASFRGLLTEKGVKAGDIVGMYLPNCVQFVKAYLAITTMGACAVLLPPHLDNMTVFGCSMKFGMKALVYSKALEEKLDIVKMKNPALPLIEGGETCDAQVSAIMVPGPAVCTVLFTGGTTGKSKGAKLTHQSIEFAFSALRSIIMKDEVGSKNIKNIIYKCNQVIGNFCAKFPVSTNVELNENTNGSSILIFEKEINAANNNKRIFTTVSNFVILSFIQVTKNNDDSIKIALIKNICKCSSKITILSRR